MNSNSEATPFVAEALEEKVVSKIKLNNEIYQIRDPSVDEKVKECKEYVDAAIQKAIYDAMNESY